MKFQCFSASADMTSALNREVQNFISENERLGMEVDSKTVHVENTGDNALIAPTIVITVWMIKR